MSQVNLYRTTILFICRQEGLSWDEGNDILKRINPAWRIARGANLKPMVERYRSQIITLIDAMKEEILLSMDKL